jgi:hypothetical protein
MEIAELKMKFAFLPIREMVYIRCLSALLDIHIILYLRVDQSFFI